MSPNSNIFRARQDFETQDQRGRAQQIEKGQLVDVPNRHVADKLLRKGKIMPKEKSSHEDYDYYPPAEVCTRTLRAGIWLKTSSHYSGGRLHMYQYALALAQNGAEVWLVTDNHPRWRHDYPECERLHIAIEGQGSIPEDFDLVITDSKGAFGAKAEQWRDEHQWAKLVTMNFETPNWVQEYCPHYADKLNAEQWRETFAAADLQLANSKPSLEYCLEWLGQQNKRSAVLPPVLNELALQQAESGEVDVQVPDRPYAVWSARAAAYKGSEVAERAVRPLELDLVTLGRPKIDEDYIHPHPDAPDREKYALMIGAEVVLAPSLFEGFGMVPQEALAIGTPVIVYDLPVLRWAYGDRLHYVEWGDEKAFAAKVREVVRSQDSVPRKAQVWVREQYGADAMRERVDALPYHTTQRRSVTAELLAWSCAETVEAALDSVYPHVDQIVCAYGPIEKAEGLWPEDDTLDILRNYNDPDGKLQIEARDVWPMKRDMRQYCADQAEGNHLLMLDADEIWIGLDKLLESDQYYGTPRWINLWHGGGHWIYDGKSEGGQRWGWPLEDYGSVCPHWRFSWWRPSYKFETHPVPCDYAGHQLTTIEQNRTVAEAVPECCIYHLGHALPPRKMQAKHDFYERRDGAPQHRRAAWHQWSGQTGRCRDGVVAGIGWKLPQIVEDALSRITAATQ